MVCFVFSVNTEKYKRLCCTFYGKGIATCQWVVVRPFLRFLSSYIYLLTFRYWSRHVREAHTMAELEHLQGMNILSCGGGRAAGSSGRS